MELSWDFLCFFLVWQTILCYDFDKSGFVEVIKISMIEVSDDAKIIDIQRVAHMLGGHYSREIIDDIENGGFSNLCELAGLKVKMV